MYHNNKICNVLCLLIATYNRYWIRILHLHNLQYLSIYNRALITDDGLKYISHIQNIDYYNKYP